MCADGSAEHDQQVRGQGIETGEIVDTGFHTAQAETARGEDGRERAEILEGDVADGEGGSHAQWRSTSSATCSGSSWGSMWPQPRTATVSTAGEKPAFIVRGLPPDTDSTIHRTAAGWNPDPAEDRPDRARGHEVVRLPGRLVGDPEIALVRGDEPRPGVVLQRFAPEAAVDLARRQVRGEFLPARPAGAKLECLVDDVPHRDADVGHGPSPRGGRQRRGIDEHQAREEIGAPACREHGQRAADGVTDTGDGRAEQAPRRLVFEEGDEIVRVIVPGECGSGADWSGHMPRFSRP